MRTEPITQEFEEDFPIVVRQSLVHTMAEMLSEMRQEFLSQSQQYREADTESIRFVQTPDDKVFWIEDNQLFWTEAGPFGFDVTRKNPVQTEGITVDKMEELLIILNILQNG